MSPLGTPFKHETVTVEELHWLAQGSDLICAIKSIRTRTGCTLSEAKAITDEIRVALGQLTRTTCVACRGAGYTYQIVTPRFH